LTKPARDFRASLPETDNRSGSRQLTRRAEIGGCSVVEDFTGEG
jgi:hypothetical protein